VEHLVSVKVNKLICDCNDSIFYGLPCRHQLAIAIKTNDFNYDYLPFAKRWSKNYYKDTFEEPEMLNLEKIKENKAGAKSKVIIYEFN